MNLGGNGAVFYRKMVEREGQEYVDALFRDKERITKADRFFYEKLIHEYQIILKDLQAKQKPPQ